MFDDIINDLCREFRKLRDRLIDYSEAEFNDFVKHALNDFWDGMPWYLRLFRRKIMKEVYKHVKDLGLL
jgi:hypothetical protein